MRKFLVVLAVLVPLTGYSVTTIMGGSVLGPGRFSLTTSLTPVYNTNFLTIFDVGVRVGLPWNLEAGLKAYWTGLIVDAKYLFLRNSFSIALDAEFILSSEIAFGCAIILDTVITPFLAVYVTGRLRYPAIRDVDYAAATASATGAVTIFRGGIEILREGPITVNLEGGTVISWRTPLPGWNVGAMISWKI